MDNDLINIYNSDNIKQYIKEKYNMSLFDFTKTLIMDTNNCDYFQNLLNIYLKIYNNLYTLDSILSKKIRKHISDKYGINSKQHILSKEIIKISDYQKNLLMNNSKLKVFNNNNSLNTYFLSDILFYIKSYLYCDDPWKVMIILLMLSGCRQIEIFNSTFQIIDLFYVKQNFVAKSKDKHKYVLKPIIYLTSKEFINILQITKNKIDINNNFIDSNNEVLSSYKNKLRKATHEIFNNNIVPYTTRKLYANLSYNIFSNNNCSFNLWITTVLGHDNLYTSIHYVNLNIDYDVQYKNILDKYIDNSQNNFVKETKKYATRQQLRDYYNKNNLFLTHFS